MILTSDMRPAISRFKPFLELDPVLDMVSQGSLGNIFAGSGFILLVRLGPERSGHEACKGSAEEDR